LADDRERPVALVHVTVADKGRLTIWFIADQRSLWVESEVLPAPELHRDLAHEFLMAKNRELFDVHFATGRDGGIYLVGRIEAAQISPERLDQVTGALVRAVEENYASVVDVSFPTWRRPARSRPAN
jgi:hypothetical protein